MFTQNWSAPQLARSVPHSSISVERPARWGISIPSSLIGKLRQGLLVEWPHQAHMVWQQLQAVHQHGSGGAARLQAAQAETTFSNLPCSPGRPHG